MLSYGRQVIAEFFFPGAPEAREPIGSWPKCALSWRLQTLRLLASFIACIDLLATGADGSVRVRKAGVRIRRVTFELAFQRGLARGRKARDLTAIVHAIRERHERLVFPAAPDTALSIELMAE